MSQSTGEAHVERRPESSAGEESPEQRKASLQPVTGPDDHRRAPLGTPAAREESVEGLMERVGKLERRTRMQFYTLIIVLLGAVGLYFKDVLLEDVIVLL